MNAKLWVALALVAATVASPVEAAPRGEVRSAQEARIAACIRRAAGGKVWLERTLWGLRDQEGGWIGAEVANRDGSRDLGPLQVNSWWVGGIARMTGKPQAHVRWWLTHDPCFNVNAARWIFLSELATAGSYWKAVGAYHSPIVWRQNRYASLVALRLAKRFGADVFRIRGKSPSQ